jgi:hypothetical protein
VEAEKKLRDEMGSIIALQFLGEGSRLGLCRGEGSCSFKLVGWRVCMNLMVVILMMSFHFY